MSEWAATLRALVADLAARDPQRRRFGARHHDYRFGPPIAPARLAAIEAGLGVRLPDDYRRHGLELGDGGAGPYHGLMPLDHPAQLACARERGVVGLAHLGCGRIALLDLGTGAVLLDAVGEIARSFDAFVAGWAHAMAHQEWPRGFVPPGQCPLPRALTAYLGDRTDVAAALAALPDGAIAIAADASPFFAAGDPVDPCPVCAAMIEHLDGLRPAHVRPGLGPLPMRDRWP